MRVEIFTADSNKLLITIKKFIADGTIKTWSVVPDANKVEYFTHNPAQWNKKALLNPSFGTNPSRLILTVTWFKTSVPDEYTKGLFIGRFTEELLEHFRQYFTKLETFA